MEKSKAGKNGERLTAEYLRSKGCTVIKMNYHFNKDNLNNMSNTLIERLTSDKRALSILSKILNMKESELNVFFKIKFDFYVKL